MRVLETYKKKRDFKKTSEPTGNEKVRSKKTTKTQEKIIFVVQKHDASHLHYDFRLECNGVLLSWAVPKGPSLNPKDKRLAMHVEDHPYDYKDFEGIIPEGNYGAGEVIVWDNGNYIPMEPGATKEENEKIIYRDYKKGSMKFVLNGKKLKGAFALVKLHGEKENEWLLIKKDDEYASEEDVLLKNKSVISRKTIESLKKDSKKKALK